MKQLFIFIALFTACANAAQAQEVYGHEEKANLTSRQGINGTEQENFTYDALDRLTEVYTTSGAGDIETEYDTNGNISYKTDIGSYLYDTQKRHAVAQTSQMPAIGEERRKVQDVTYNTAIKREQSDACIISAEREQGRPQANSHGMPAFVEEGGNTLTFFYGPDNERWQTTMMRDGEVVKTITFLGDYERVDTAGITHEYWYVADGVILYRETPQVGQPSAVTPLYALTDNLSSYVRLYTENGTAVFSAGYDAWGQQYVNAVGSPPAPLSSFTFHRGYTGHEMLPAFGLINMNGRLYDPAIARFLSPDNYVQLPDNAQNFNRYSYCLNNPLKYTDPSGEFFWLIPAAIGGVVNLVSNAFSGHVNSFWQGLTHFLTGAGAGLLSAYGMPIPAAGFLGTVNNITNQGFENGWSNINYQSALFDGIVSMFSARVTQYVSNTLSKPISELTKGIANPIIRNIVTDATINAVVSGGMNTGMVLLNGGSFKDAMNSGWQGLWQGAARH